MGESFRLWDTLLAADFHQEEGEPLVPRFRFIDYIVVAVV